jgi:hypothetical protein
MKTKLSYIAAFILTFTLSVVAFAQVNPRTLGDIFGYKAVVITRDTGVSDPRAGALHIGRLGSEFPSTTSRITRLIGASGTILNADGGQTFVGCAESSLTVSGARLGDLCIANQPAGIQPDAGISTGVTCRVSAANTVRLRFCPLPPDTYTVPLPVSIPVTVISNQ